VDLPHSGAVMHYSGYTEPWDGALSILLLLHACGVFRKKVTVVKGSLWAAEIENVAVWATGKYQVLPKIRQMR
jgi:hypothetical protein